MKKGIIFVVVAVILVTGLVFGADLLGFANLADPKPGV